MKSRKVVSDYTSLESVCDDSADIMGDDTNSQCLGISDCVNLYNLIMEM